MLSFLFSPDWVSAGKKELPRKWGVFELNKTRSELKNDLALFTCVDKNPKASECRLLGYPTIDDFLAIRFFDGKLASVMEFRVGINWEKTLESVIDDMGEPSLPEYKSDRAVAYVWQDENTLIALSKFTATGYIVYEIRDRKLEQLYRKSMETWGK